MCSLTIILLLSFKLLSEAQCGDDPIDPAKDVPFDEVIEALDEPGVVYLTVINGDTPKPNKCGLNPTNDAAEWTGWGGPLNHDNMSIGEGPTTRNLITIEGVRCQRGVGTHAIANLVYDLTGLDYRAFHAFVGVDDETGAGVIQFTFNIDGKEVYQTEEMTQDKEGEVVDFDIPKGAKELHIYIDNRGDNC
jgi:hypothetical protein